MIIQHTLDPNAKITDEQRAELREARKRPIDFSDAPELTPEQIELFRQAVLERNRRMKKQTVSVRLDRQTIERAKSIDENYTTLLAQIIFTVLHDPELLDQILLPQGYKQVW